MLDASAHGIFPRSRFFVPPPPQARGACNLPGDVLNGGFCCYTLHEWQRIRTVCDQVITIPVLPSLASIQYTQQVTAWRGLLFVRKSSKIRNRKLSIVGRTVEKEVSKSRFRPLGEFWHQSLFNLAGCFPMLDLLDGRADLAGE